MRRFLGSLSLALLLTACPAEDDATDDDAAGTSDDVGQDEAGSDILDDQASDDSDVHGDRDPCWNRTTGMMGFRSDMSEDECVDPCTNGVQDSAFRDGPDVVHEESDTDCGGTCGPCGLGQRCRLRVPGVNQWYEDDASCEIGFCLARVCGGFQPPAEVGVSGVPQTMTDSLVDAVLVGTTSGLFYMTPEGGRSLSAGAPVASVAAGVFFNTGAFDIVVANGSQGAVHSLLSTGDGTSWQAPIRTDVGGEPIWLDVSLWTTTEANRGIIVLDSDGSLSAIPGNGDGTFGSATTVAENLAVDVEVITKYGTQIPPRFLVGGDDGLHILPITADLAAGELIEVATTPITSFSLPGRFHPCDRAITPDCSIATHDILFGSADSAQVGHIEATVDGEFLPPVTFDVAEVPRAVSNHLVNVGGIGIVQIIASLGATTLSVTYGVIVPCEDGCEVACGTSGCETAPGINERTYTRIDYPIDGDFDLLEFAYDGTLYIGGPSGLMSMTWGQAQ